MKKKSFLHYSRDKSFVRMPLPETDAELEVITQQYFGKPLHLRDLTCSGSYRVKEPYNDYHGKEWSFSQGSIKGYDHSRKFWDYVCGKLHCGGISFYSYGQFLFSERGYRHQKRICKWVSNRKMQANYLRTPFKRLAGSLGCQREQNNSR